MNAGPEPDRAPERGGAPQTLSDALGRWLDHRGWRERLRDGEVHRRWCEIAGDDVAAHAEPVRLHGGVLVVRAESGVWATQLRYLGPRLLERAQQVVGSDRVHRVQVISGDLTRPDDARDPGA